MASSGSKATKGDMFIDDLTHIQSFLSTQKRTVKKEAFKKMLDNQVGSWVARINNTNIQPAEAATIGELLGEGPWFDEHHELLSDALASKMAGAASGDSSTQRRPLQTLNCFASYLTESDLKLLSDPEVHNVNKVQKLVAKCVALGLHLPKETTTKQIIKTAIDCGMKVAPGPETLRIVNEFKQQLKSKVKHLAKVPLPEKFPDDPANLPKDVFNRVFEDEQPSPPRQNCAGAESAIVVARKSHASVKKALPFQDNNPMAAMMSQMNQMMQPNSGSGGSGGINPMMLMFAGMQQLMGGGELGETSSVRNLQIFGGKKRQKTLSNVADASLTDPKGLPDKAQVLPVEDGPVEGQEEEDEEDDTQTSQSKKKTMSGGKHDRKPMFKLELGSGVDPKATKEPSDYAKLFAASVKSRERARAVVKRPAASPAEAVESPRKSMKKAETAVKKPPAPKKKADKKKAAAPATAEPAPKEPAERVNLGPKPPPPDPWTGTFYWGSGKVHKNPKSACWRAFVHKTDKNDRKVKLGDDLTASFHRALEIIEEGMSQRGL
ncbi:unnamed protein product [Durusdinium trenchii]|uniref:Uncharacterized protein n=1 Tax=Durusdinium trenchii TaxID=1381693 RepID=A0ABP0HN70_9DINO